MVPDPEESIYLISSNLTLKLKGDIILYVL